MRIGLSPGCRDIHLESVREREPRRRKPFKHRQPSPIPVCHHPRKSNPVSLYRKIEIQVLSLQQKIADDSTDQVDRHTSLVSKSADLFQQMQRPHRYSVQQNGLPYRVLHGTPL